MGYGGSEIHMTVRTHVTLPTYGGNLIDHFSYLNIMTILRSAQDLSRADKVMSRSSSPLRISLRYHVTFGARYLALNLVISKDPLSRSLFSQQHVYRVTIQCAVGKRVKCPH